MANRITCQHDPLQPNCSLILESGILGRRVRCEACDIAAVAKANGTFKCSPYPPARPSLETPVRPNPRWCSTHGGHEYGPCPECPTVNRRTDQ